MGDDLADWLDQEIQLRNAAAKAAAAAANAEAAQAKADAAKREAAKRMILEGADDWDIHWKIRLTLDEVRELRATMGETEEGSQT